MAKEGQRSVLDQNAMTLFSKEPKWQPAFFGGLSGRGYAPQGGSCVRLLDVYASTVALSLENVGLPDGSAQALCVL